MIERGGYKGMDACLMAHPGPGPGKSAGTGSALAIKSMSVEFFGHRCVGKCIRSGCNSKSLLVLTLVPSLGKVKMRWTPPF
jgi:hypothetical protein